MKENSEKEFLSVLEQHLNMVVKIVNVYAYNNEDRKELMSDIVFELWKSYPKFRGESKVSTWLYRISLNVALKTKRKRDNNKLLFVEELLTFNNTAFADTSDNQPVIDLLYRCIERLSPVNKAIILLYLDDKSNDEIAEVMGMTKTNVSTRLSRIREELRVCMIKNKEYGTE